MKEKQWNFLSRENVKGGYIITRYLRASTQGFLLRTETYVSMDKGDRIMSSSLCWIDVNDMRLIDRLQVEDDDEGGEDDDGGGE